MKIGIYDGLTGEQIERDATPVEKALLEAEAEQAIIDKQAKRNAAETLWNTKVSAYEKLGLTAEEIEALAPKPEWLKINAALGL